MKKALMITSVASMIKQFNMPNIDILQKLGYEVTVATNFNEPGTIPIDDSKELYRRLKEIGVVTINVNFSRSPFSLQNLQAYKQLKSIMTKNDYNLVHCQSPIGGVLSRIAGRNTRKRGTKIIYTAHGFHFFKGAPWKNWLFYPVEKFLSSFTDILITINHEDYARGEKFHAKEVVYVPGVGVDTYKFSDCNINKETKRKELKIPLDSFLVLSVGEINDRKNHRVIIEAINRINNSNIHYAICGQGPNENKLRELVNSYGIMNQVHFLGYRNDINELYKFADVFAFPSKREGLGLAGIEAMSTGLPLISSNINGINDYSINGVTGFSYDPKDISGFQEGILRLYKLSKKEIGRIEKTNTEKSREFDQEKVNFIMREIYIGSDNECQSS